MEFNNLAGKEININSLFYEIDHFLAESKKYATVGDFCYVANSLRNARRLLERIDCNDSRYNHAKLKYKETHVQCEKRLE